MNADKKFHSKTIHICDDCYELKGECCNEPECVFCRKSMEEVALALHMTMVRPLIEGERLRL